MPSTRLSRGPRLARSL